MIIDRIHSGIQPIPNISRHINIVATGHFVTVLNIAAIPNAAPIVTSMQNKIAKYPPSVAPMQKEGTISPPLSPIETDITVNIIFSKKS